jgi:hypothetical protein
VVAHKALLINKAVVVLAAKHNTTVALHGHPVAVQQVTQRHPEAAPHLAIQHLQLAAVARQEVAVPREVAEVPQEAVPRKAVVAQGDNNITKV